MGRRRNGRDTPVVLGSKKSAPSPRKKNRRCLGILFLERERRGKQRCWKRFISTDTGCRLSKDGAKKKTYESPVKD
eukprot:1003652-Pyramimonas_sp.AAC.1